MSVQITDEPYFLDIMDKVKQERKRLEGIVDSKEYLKNPQWKWMEGWLAKPDDEHYKTWFNGECNVCGKKHRFFLRLDFSFCDEYGCGMQICSKCIRKLKKIFTIGAKEVGLKQAEQRSED